MKNITESVSNFDHLDKMSTLELLQGINSEDKKVAFAVENEISEIQCFVDACYERMKRGGRLLVMGF